MLMMGFIKDNPFGVDMVVGLKQFSEGHGVKRAVPSRHPIDGCLMKGGKRNGGQNQGTDWAQ